MFGTVLFGIIDYDDPFCSSLYLYLVFCLFFFFSYGYQIFLIYTW